MTDGLKRGVLGTAGVFFNSLAGQAPVYSVASGAALIMGSAGAAAPLAMLITSAGMLAIVFSVYVMARRYPHAASFYEYASRAFGPRVGAFTGYVYSILYGLLATASVAVAFSYLAVQGAYAIGLRVNPLPFLPVILLLPLVPALLGIRVSVKLQMVTTSVEVLVLLGFALLSVFENPLRLTAYPFTPAATFQVSPIGELGALAGGLVFSVTYFMGFETSTQLSEEAKDPKRSVPLGTLFATAFMGLVFMLSTYALVIDAGFSKGQIDSFVSSASSGLNPVYPFVGRYLGSAGLYAFIIASLLSVFSCYLATLNSVTRMFYGMARDGVLPSSLSKLNSRQSPSLAAYFVTGISAAVLVIGYVVEIALSGGNALESTFSVMEYTYAVDSLYYAVSLLVVAIAAFKVTRLGKAVSMLGSGMLVTTLYYSVTDMFTLLFLVIPLFVAFLFAVFRLRGAPKVSRRVQAFSCRIG
ncbi:MAG: APC family permease [Thermoprotei archaeon]